MVGKVSGYRSKLLVGVSLTVLSALTISQPAFADKLDDILARLDRLEKSNAKLERENAALRHRVGEIGSRKSAVVVESSDKTKNLGNPVRHEAVATSPVPEHTVVGIAGAPLWTKAPGSNAFLDNTTVTLYGYANLSVDLFNPGVYDQGTKLGIASNLSNFGVRVHHNLGPYGWPGYAVVAQFESLVEVAATPTERAAFGTRNSYLGVQAPGFGNVPGKPLPLPRDDVPGQLNSPNAKSLLSLAGFCPGENIALNWKPCHTGDSYQIACGARQSNSARRSPPVLPMIEL